jgi:signal transduction histidine kinase
VSEASGCSVLLVSDDAERRARAAEALASSCQLLQASDLSSAMDELSLGQPLIVLIDSEMPHDQLTGLLHLIGEPERTVLWGGDFKLELLDYGAFVQIPDTVAEGVLAAAVMRLADVQRTKAALKTQRDRVDRIDKLMATIEVVRHEVKSPLTAIIAETELLLMDADKLSEEHVNSLQTIEAMTQRVRHLVGRLHGLDADG